MSYTSLVAEFHSAFKYKTPEPQSPDLSCCATNALRPRLIREEAEELAQAIASNDRRGQLDALGDIQYVLSGAILAWGYRSMWSAHVPTIELRHIRNMDSHLATMRGLITQMEVAVEGGFPSTLFSTLCDFQNRLNMCIWHLGFSPVFADAFAEIHRSNMSKIWKQSDFTPGSASISDSIEGTIGGWIVRRADGKIKKPDSYSPARLEKFI